MIWLVAFCALGIPAGFLLLWRVPLCRANEETCHDAISVIIPARNEDRNLPRLLQSIRASRKQPAEVLVVDDCSQDATAAVAEAHGATVVRSSSLPRGWTGKTWACFQGAEEASADLLLFLDADTFFSRDGYERLADMYCGAGDGALAVSVLPYHVVEKWYEELSLFFNLLMAMGAGGFGLLDRPRLFGQSLIISRDLYKVSGGHEGVAREILENFSMSAKLEAVGGRCLCVGGRGVLNVRMFPDGLEQLREGWTKAFADGAANTSGLVLGVSVLWLTALCTSFFALLMTSGVWLWAVYLALGGQLYFFARQIGNFSVISCLVHPVPLFFYFGLFGQSLYLRVFRRRVSWRGRVL